jgi:hypothetical protein
MSETHVADNVDQRGPSQATLNQALFDRMYITSLEIQQRLKVNRCSVTFAHQRGSLPQPILVGSTHIWLRVEAEPYLLKWERNLTTKRAKREQAE